jgi:hypothetical protein
MNQVVSAKTLTLRDLERRFNLGNSTDPSFFREWHLQLPSLTTLEEQWLDRIKANYLNLTKSHPILEDLAKMVVVSPLLDLAGFYQEPFEVETEFAIQIAVKEGTTVVQGRIDVLVLQGLLWVLVIESKNSGLSLEPGIPQALTYMLDHPNSQQPVFGLVTNGSNFLFLKLLCQDLPHYALSDEFSLRRGQDLYTVLKILKRLSELVGPRLP